ncbi:MAG: diguanylate cyclase [Cyanobacteria bacterium J06600_6]
MISVLSPSLASTQYIPHGHCYLWQTPLVGLHVAADALIAIAYYLIPIFIIYFVRRIEELPFKNVFILFGAFILSCGTAHLVEIWTLWHPDYWVYGILKAITALISLYTAFSLLPIIPIIINLPSPKQLEILNQQLNEKIAAEETAKKELAQLNQELEQRVAEKTSALTTANCELQKSTNFVQKIADTAPNLLYIYDFKTKRNIFCNPFINELLGYSVSAIQKFESNILSELIHPEDMPQVVEHQTRCLSLKDDDYLEIEYRIKDKYGEWYWLQDKNIIFNRNSQGQPEQILGIAQNITHRKKAELRMELLNQKLSQQVEILEVRDRTRVQLSKMVRLIQVCTSFEEAQKIVVDLIQPLFPDTRGSIYLMSNSKNAVDAIATWGNVTSDRHFNSKDCWAIRLSDYYSAAPDTPELYCDHVHDLDLCPSLCLPMIAEGETIGILHLQFSNNTGEIPRSTINLAETVVQNLALSFANLKLQQELRYQSFHDPLTGLYNRRYLEESLKKEIDRAQRKQEFVSIIMLDVDLFKRFNDVHGHQAGDLVLSKVGAYLKSAIREYDLACRYGGEEIIVVMPDATIDNSILRAETIRAGIKALTIEHNGKQLEPVTVSIGISCFPDDGIDSEKLIDAADKALYQAKADGRDCVRRC